MSTTKVPLVQARVGEAPKAPVGARVAGGRRVKGIAQQRQKTTEANTFRLYLSDLIKKYNGRPLTPIISVVINAVTITAPKSLFLLKGGSFLLQTNEPIPYKDLVKPTTGQEQSTDLEQPNPTVDTTTEASDTNTTTTTPAEASYTTTTTINRSGDIITTVSPKIPSFNRFAKRIIGDLQKHQLYGTVVPVDRIVIRLKSHFYLCQTCVHPINERCCLLTGTEGLNFNPSDMMSNIRPPPTGASVELNETDATESPLDNISGVVKDTEIASGDDEEAPDLVAIFSPGKNTDGAMADPKDVDIADADVALIMSQCNCSRERAVSALMSYDNDVVNAVLSLM
jgi:NACalpha-BTF3-like transcription factor